MGQQQYMAQLLAQIKPKEAKWEVKEIKTEDGGVKTVLMNMNAANPLSTAIEAGKQGPKATYEDVGNKKVPVTGYGTTPELVKALTPGDVQAREISDRAFNQLSVQQRAQLENDAARLKISAQQLFFDTGLQASGGARLPPPVTPSAATPTGAPIVPAAMPAALAGAQPVVARPAAATPVAARPTAAAPAPSVVSGLTPKAQQALMLEDAQAKAKKERGMSGIGSVIDEARKIMKGEAVDKDGKPIKAPLPTQSYAGAAGDFISGVFGGSSEGAAQADQLKVLGGALLSSMPRMEGPQGEKDVDLYREMAGQVGDNTLSVARRLKALDMVEKLYRKYDTSDVPPPNAVRRIR